MLPVAQTHHQLHYTGCETRTAAASNEALCVLVTPASLWTAYQNYCSHPFEHMKQLKKCLMGFHDIYTGELPEICTTAPILVQSDNYNRHVMRMSVCKGLNWQCHGTSSLLVAQCSLLGQSVWHFECRKWHWDRFCSAHFSLPLSPSFHQHSTFEGQ